MGQSRAAIVLEWTKVGVNVHLVTGLVEDHIQVVIEDEVVASGVGLKVVLSEIVNSVCRRKNRIRVKDNVVGGRIDDHVHYVMPKRTIVHIDVSNSGRTRAVNC